MNFFEAVKTRRSIRSFLEKEIEQDKIDILLQTINAAPSAGNLQGYEVVVVRNVSTKEALTKSAYGQGFIMQAPVALVFCANHLLSSSKYGERGGNLYAVQDATIAAAYCQLAATSMGLATVWVGAFDPDLAAKAVQTPEHVTPVAIIPVGYAAEAPNMRPRRALDDLIRKETWSGK
jgi:nitroreductase